MPFSRKSSQPTDQTCIPYVYLYWQAGSLPLVPPGSHKLPSVQFSYSVMSYSLQHHGLQHTRLPCPSATPGACSNSCPSCWWCHPTILFPVIPVSSCLQSFPASQSFPVSQTFASGASAPEVLELQHPSFQWIFSTDFLKDWLVWSPCSPRDCQESSLRPRFKGINSLALSLLYGPTLTSIYDYWKNHSFDYTEAPLALFQFQLWFLYVGMIY